MSEAAVLSRPRTAAAHGGSVLIIDDEVAIRESLETLLEFEGYSVESAETGEDGLARLSERAFDGLLHGYDRSLRVVLRHKLVTLLVSFLVIGLTFYLYTMNSTMLPLSAIQSLTETVASDMSVKTETTDISAMTEART